MIGKTFWRLTVSHETCSDKHWKKYYWCICSCGNQKSIAKASLIKWLTKSCWCLRKEITKSRYTIHGKIHSIAYSIWTWMNQRCYYTKHKQYKDYGWRWIIVEWNSFKEFYDTFGYQFTKWLSIERKNVNGNYSFDNCIVIPLSQQNNNRRSTIRVEVDGKVVCLTEACRIKWVPYERVRQRISKLWWDIHRALNS